MSGLWDFQHDDALAQGAHPIGRPITYFLSAGQVSDNTGAAFLLRELLKADWLIADRGYDADWFKDALENKEIRVSIPGQKKRKAPVKYDKQH